MRLIERVRRESTQKSHQEEEEIKKEQEVERYHWMGKGCFVNGVEEPLNARYKDTRNVPETSDIFAFLRTKVVLQ